MTTTNSKLGDKVSGIYFDVPFTGIIVSVDSTGWCHVKCEPISVMGSVRTSISLSPSDRVRNPLTIVEAGPELVDGDVGNILDHYFLRARVA